MSLAKIRAEGKRAIEGAWVNGQIHGLGDELQLKVRGRWNPEFRALHAKLQAQVPNSRKTRTEFGMEITPAEGDRIITECLIETVLVDWKGLTLTDDHPEQLPFSKEKARELLMDPELAPFRDGVLIASGHVAKEGKEVFEADEKN